VPYLSMVNLIAGRMLAPELMQDDMTAESIAAAATPLLQDPAAANAMREGLAEIRRAISREGDPFERAAGLIVRGHPGILKKDHEVSRKDAKGAKD